MLPGHGRAHAVLLCGAARDLPLRGRALDARRRRRGRAPGACGHSERPGVRWQSHTGFKSKLTLRVSFHQAKPAAILCKKNVFILIVNKILRFVI